MTEWPWDELEIEKTRDLKDIRRAYSAKLKRLDLDKQIEEYNRLRQARGYALYLAQNEEEEDHLVGDPLGGELGDRADDDVLSGGFDDDPLGDPLHDPLHDPLAGQAGRTDDGLASPVEDDMAVQDAPMAPQLSPEELQLEEHWRTLNRLVLPDGEQSDDAFTHDEWEETNSALQNIFDIASSASLDLHDNVDYHLSELLAIGWPRSAPLVEAANTEFNWFAEVGQITERPTLVFLNARLAGMRFQEEVEAPGHEFHKAWTDLQSGTTPVWLQRYRQSRDKVLELLAVIRQHFPELEALLDDDRIYKWEHATTSSVARWVQIIAIGWFALSALGYCARVMDPSPSAHDILGADRAAVDEVYAELVPELLGDNWTPEVLEMTSPRFAGAIENAAMIRRGLDGEPNLALAEDEARHVLRVLLLAGRDKFGFDDQVRVQQLYLTWLLMARADSLPRCRAMLNSADLTPRLAGDGDGAADVTATYEEEAELMDILLAQGDPMDNLTTEERSVSIPGWIIGEMIESTGLSQEQVGQALAVPGDDNNCDVMIAMMEVVARAPGNAPAELLTWP